jgi:hypothetical protein
VVFKTASSSVFMFMVEIEPYRLRFVKSRFVTISRRHKRAAQAGPIERVGNLLTPALSSTRAWRRGRRRGSFSCMSQPFIFGKRSTI